MFETDYPTDTEGYGEDIYGDTIPNDIEAQLALMGALDN